MGSCWIWCPPTSKYTSHWYINSVMNIAVHLLWNLEYSRFWYVRSPKCVEHFCFKSYQNNTLRSKESDYSFPEEFIKPALNFLYRICFTHHSELTAPWKITSIQAEGNHRKPQDSWFAVQGSNLGPPIWYKNAVYSTAVFIVFNISTVQKDMWEVSWISCWSATFMKHPQII
jgi:hypothetical protein